MKYKFTIVFIFLSSILLGGCKQYTEFNGGTSNNSDNEILSITSNPIVNEEINLTQITIDGKADDWVSYAVMSNDEEGDSLNGTIDLSEIRAFVNNEYLYIMVAYYQDGPFDHMIFRIGEEDGNGRTLNIWPGEYSKYENAPGENFEEFNAISAQGDVIEIKVPLVDLGIVPFAIHRLETYCGKTASCDRGDGIDGDNIIAVDEIEETAVLAVQIEATSTPANISPTNFPPNMEPTPTEAPIFTEIIIDGNKNDWNDYDVLATDQTGDQIEGMLDLAEMSAFLNNEYFYILITTNNWDYFDHIIFGIGGKNGGNYQLNVWPGHKSQISQAGEPFEDIQSQTTLGDVIEVKIALKDLGFTPTDIYAIENCCGSGDARGDSMNGAAIPRPEEIEPYQELLAKNEEGLFYEGDIEANFWVAGHRERGTYLDHSIMIQMANVEYGPDGYIYVCSPDIYEITRVSPDGDLVDLELWRTNPSLRINGPGSVSFDSKGIMYITNAVSIMRMKNGIGTTLEGLVRGLLSKAIFDADDTMFYASRDPDDGGVFMWEDGISTRIASIPLAEDLAFGPDGRLYVTAMNTGVFVVDMDTREVTPFWIPERVWDQVWIDFDLEGDLWIRSSFYLEQFSLEGQEKPFTINVDGQIISGGDYNWHTSSGLAIDDQGNIWVAAFQGALWKLTLSDSAKTVPNYIFSDVYESMVVNGMAFGLDGELYAFDASTENMYRYSSNGEKELIHDFGNVIGLGRGPGTVAVDGQGQVYLGFVNSIYRFDADLNPIFYAPVKTPSMVIGKDEAIYAMRGGNGTSYDLVRITGENQVEFILNSIEGRRFGTYSISIAVYGDEGFLIHDFQLKTTFFVDYEGNGSVFKEDYGDDYLGSIHVSPITNDIFILSSGQIQWVSPDGKETQVYAIWTAGDPTMMAISPDGKNIYWAPNGGIGILPIIDFWWD
ncbi:MAG: hypothetical protein HOJ58_10240 [Chloroflexi bacterium]|nr:hypothetical protein [Chloroflexota bacterium]